VHALCETTVRARTPNRYSPRLSSCTSSRRPIGAGGQRAGSGEQGPQDPDPDTRGCSNGHQGINHLSDRDRRTHHRPVLLQRIMITRRTLLKGLAAASAAALVPTLSKGRGDYQIYDDPIIQTEGFGLAQVKPEGGTYRPDPMGSKARAVIHQACHEANEHVRGLYPELFA